MTRGNSAGKPTTWISSQDIRESSTTQTVQVSVALVGKILEIAKNLPSDELMTSNLKAEIESLQARVGRPDSKLAAKEAFERIPAKQNFPEQVLPKLVQQIEERIHSYLVRLYQATNQGTNEPIQPQFKLISPLFRELGTILERLKLAAEEASFSHEKLKEDLATARAAAVIEQQRYQQLSELVLDGYLVTGSDGVIREANRAAAVQLNIPQSLLVGKSLATFVAEEDRLSFDCKLGQLCQTNQIQSEWETCLSSSFGQPFDAVLKIATVRNLEGELVSLHWLIQDVTERKRARAAFEKKGSELSQGRLFQSYARGEAIPLNPQAIWQVNQGWVKLSTFCSRGEEILLGLAGPSMLFGPTLTALPVYQATVLSDQAQLVPIFLTEITASPSLAQALLPRINQRLRQSEAFAAVCGQRHVTERLNQLLLLLSREIGQPVPQGIRLSIRLTHEELAHACGTTRVTITRRLSELQRRGKIVLDANRYLILVAHQAGW